MAFRMTFESDMGISLPDTYCYVHKIGGSKDLLYVQVNWYISEEVRHSDLKPIDSKGYSFVPDVTDESYNFIKQAYLYLKTLEEFAEAVDC
jgi:hypothetical protein